MSAWDLQPESRHVWWLMNVSGRAMANVHVITDGRVVAHARRNWETREEFVDDGEGIRIGGVAAADRDRSDPEQQPRVRVTFDGEDGTSRRFETHDFDLG